MACEPAFESDGHIVASEGFNYDAIDGVEPNEDKIGELSEDQYRVLLKLFTTLLRWIYQDGANNPEGVQIRAELACWHFLPEFKNTSLTQLSKCYGKHKQSLHRWQKHFKKTFPEIKPPHMQTPK